MTGQAQRQVGIAGLVLAATLLGSHIHAQSVAQDGPTASGDPLANQEFTAFIKEGLDYSKTPGMAIAVVRGSRVYTQGFGVANLNGTKVTPETLFYAGSTTKAQTTACLSLLMNKGSYEALKSNWSTPLSSILKDEMVFQDEWATNHLTLEDAACHRTGMPRHDRAMRHNASPRESTQDLRNLPFAEEPRTAFIYKNYMYVVLSAAIEAVTQKSIKEAMKELIWDPLGMKSTYFGLEDVKANNALSKLALGHVPYDSSSGSKETLLMPGTEISGAAAIISTVSDYAQWVLALNNATKHLPDSVHEDIRFPRIITKAQPGRPLGLELYSVGWFWSSFHGRNMYRHDGSMQGYQSQVTWFPDEQFGLVIFANAQQSTKSINLVAARLMAENFGLPVETIANVTESRLDEPERSYEEILNAIFPDWPQKLSKISVNLSDLEGTYRDAGYGDLKFRIENSAPGNETLRADRPDMTSSITLRASPVLENKWIVCQNWIDEPLNNEACWFHRGEFTRGADAKPEEFVISWLDSDNFAVEAITAFRKV